MLPPLSTIPTPFVAIDRAVVRRNIVAMQTRARAAGVALRPHAKTHKSPVIARWQIDAGAVGICCAKLGEAEVFAAAGVDDIRLPYPVHPTNADRVVALVDRTRLSIIVDDEEVARGWSAAMTRAGRTLDVLVKVDVGFHRCGVDPDAPPTTDVIARIASLRGLRFRGLLSHAGHAYGASSVKDLETIADREIAILATLATRLRAMGVEVTELSVGSTPTARFIDRQKGATEMRPGNYVFFDRTQVGLGAASFGDCGLSAMSTVVSRPAPDRAILDAGAKTLAADGARGFGASPGHGALFAPMDARVPDESCVLERVSEEHTTMRVPAGHHLRIGDRVRIVPNHSCVVTNLVDELVVIEHGEAVDRIPVAARGRIA